MDKTSKVIISAASIDIDIVNLRTKGPLRCAPYIQPAYSWLLHNLHNPYPSRELKESLSRTTGSSVKLIEGWFVDVRKRMGWSKVKKVHFQNRRKPLVDAATCFFVSGQPVSPRLASSFEEMAASAKNLYRHKFSEAKCIDESSNGSSSGSVFYPSPQPSPDCFGPLLSPLSTTKDITSSSPKRSHTQKTAPSSRKRPRLDETQQVAPSPKGSKRARYVMRWTWGDFTNIVPRYDSPLKRITPEVSLISPAPSPPNSLVLTSLPSDLMTRKIELPPPKSKRWTTYSLTWPQHHSSVPMTDLRPISSPVSSTESLKDTLEILVSPTVDTVCSELLSNEGKDDQLPLNEHPASNAPVVSCVLEAPLHSSIPSIDASSVGRDVHFNFEPPGLSSGGFPPALDLSLFHSDVFDGYQMPALNNENDIPRQLPGRADLISPDLISSAIGTNPDAFAGLLHGPCDDEQLNELLPSSFGQRIGAVSPIQEGHLPELSDVDMNFTSVLNVHTTVPSVDSVSNFLGGTSETDPVNRLAQLKRLKKHAAHVQECINSM